MDPRERKLGRPLRTQFWAAIYKYHLLDVVFESSLTPEYGAPCLAPALRTLFKGDKIHLTDKAHALLGAYAAETIAAQWPRLRPSSALVQAPAAGGRGGKPLCLMAGGAMGKTKHSLERAFVGEGWEHASNVPDRPDKACWLSVTTQRNGLISREPVSFTRLEVFVERSPKGHGNITVRWRIGGG
jgi:hypothetical protein